MSLRTLLIAGLLSATTSAYAQPYLVATPASPSTAKQQPAGPVWVVQSNSGTQGPVWVVVDQRKAKTPG